MNGIISLMFNWQLSAVVFSYVALNILPNDSKALFRRCQGQEKLGRLESAFRDARTLIHIEPKVSADQKKNICALLNWSSSGPLFVVQCYVVKEGPSLSAIITVLLWSLESFGVVVSKSVLGGSHCRGYSWFGTLHKATNSISSTPGWMGCCRLYM